MLPSRVGTELDVAQTAKALMRAATSRANRVARVVVVKAAPERTTREALAMGIDRRMSAYKTYNSGTWDRITNLRLGVAALDDTLVPPGGTFSLNEAIGERTEERGFRSAPVIIGTRYEEEVGGGTSQVATTVFNAAWEAGLDITERNPHSLYIDRYQLGRDATVYWPSLDLEFVNDTKTWVLVKGFAEADGISIAIYGGETRRVESSDGTFEITGSPPVKRVNDPTMLKGTTLVEASGTSPSRTSVTRTVYSAQRPGPARRDVEHELPRRGARDQGRDEGRAEAQAAPEEAAAARRDYAAADSALATASTSHSGTRVGRYVPLSTVAWLDEPSATSSPSRTTRYS